MIRSSSQWLLGLLTLLLLFVIGCPGGGAPGPPTDPSNPFIPNPGGGSGGSGQPLNAPAEVTGSAGNQQIRVQFSAVPGAAGYNLYISEDGSTFVRNNSNSPYTTTNVLVTGLTNDQVYFVGVSAVYGNAESNTRYAGGSPTAAPLIPSAEPVVGGPISDDVDPVINLTPWTPENAPDGLGMDPNDRRLLFSWTYNDNSDLKMFRVQFAAAARHLDGSLYLPNESEENLIIFEEHWQPKGARATLRDPNFVDLADPAMTYIRNNVGTAGRPRDEGVLQFPYGNNIILKVMQASKLSATSFVNLLLGPDYGYTEANLGLSIKSNGALSANQDTLDGTDRLGIAIGVAPVFRDGSIGKNQWGFSYYTDDVPVALSALGVVPVSNPNWDDADGDSSPVLPQLNWQRPYFPMGSDIEDYGIVRVGKVEPRDNAPDISIVFRLSQNGQTAIFSDGEKDLREIYAWTDNKFPDILRGRLYTYSVFPIDRAGLFGAFSPSATIRPGGALNQPPLLDVVITQGGTEIYPEGTGKILTGEGAGLVVIDLSESRDPEGSALSYFYQLIPGNPDPVQSPSPTINFPGIACVGAEDQRTLRVGVADESNLVTTEDVLITLAPGPSC